MKSWMVVVKRQDDAAVACYGVIICRLHRSTDENDEGSSDRKLGRWPGFGPGSSRMSVRSLTSAGCVVCFMYAVFKVSQCLRPRSVEGKMANEYN
jgi:hypothetical protein